VEEAEKPPLPGDRTRVAQVRGSGSRIIRAWVADIGPGGAGIIASGWAPASRTAHTIRKAANSRNSPLSSSVIHPTEQ
jgi:hypothetical protein